jgi:ElaA protein
MIASVKCVPFSELSLNELYDIMYLRQEVFVVEQNCPFIDADYKDQPAWHLMCSDAKGKLIAYTRLLGAGDAYEGYSSIGRVVNAASTRGTGVGRELMRLSIAHIEMLFPNNDIKIGAQSYLLPFYRSFGFEVIGEEYLEDGILHTHMIRSTKSTL